MCDSVERYLNLHDIQQFTVKESISLKDVRKNVYVTYTVTKT